ncbi:hypothetical protein [Sinorhizobium meliloti]
MQVLGSLSWLLAQAPHCTCLRTSSAQASNKLSDYLRSEAITHATLPPALLQASKRSGMFGIASSHSCWRTAESRTRLESLAPGILSSTLMARPKQQSARRFGVARLILMGQSSRDRPSDCEHAVVSAGRSWCAGAVRGGG